MGLVLTSTSSQAEVMMSRLAGLPVPMVIPLVIATWLVLLTPRATLEDPSWKLRPQREPSLTGGEEVERRTSPFLMENL